MKKRVRYWLIGSGAVYVWLIAMMVFLSPRSDVLNAASADGTSITYANVAISPSADTRSKELFSAYVFKHPTYGYQASAQRVIAGTTPKTNLFSRSRNVKVSATSISFEGVFDNALLIKVIIARATATAPCKITYQSKTALTDSYKTVKTYSAAATDLCYIKPI